MKKDIININSTLPTINKTYSSFDILGKTVGRYFDYKRETAMIKHETIKIREQAKIIVKNIEAELKKSLDKNQKDSKKEMFRLKTIANELKRGSKNKDSLLEYIFELSRALTNPDIPDSTKEHISNLVAMAHQQFSEERDASIQKLNLMSNFDPNIKSIGGE